MANRVRVGQEALEALSRLASNADPEVRKAASAVTEHLGAIIAAENTLRLHVGEFYVLMNAFASGDTQKSWARAEPLAVMSEGYGILASGLTRADEALGEIGALDRE